ncbi:MAG: ABC transporter ATP-binding protein [Acidimicrobiia bacterium]|nr:ABC transporter ATP-binding protein [Acidimicrobiia bacterium]
MSFGATEVLHDVSVSVPSGGMLALLGPSGCGKTTLLRIIAGLETPSGGSVRVGDRTLVDGTSAQPPERRRIGMVFQDWALFPHLDVATNVGYGLPRSVRGAERTRRVRDALDMVGLVGLEDRMPATLSGGQQQRVALARALAPEPAVLLLDEPFSNLDASLRAQVRTEVHELLVGLGITTVIVTHDQEEAFVLGDEVAVLADGRLVQQATPAELYRRPTSAWVAGFVGDANLVAGRMAGAEATTAVGSVALAQPLGDGDEVAVLLRPEDCKLLAGGDARVQLVEFYGHDTMYVVALPDGTRLSVREAATPTHRRGDAVTPVYAGGATVAFPPESSTLLR